MHLADRARPTSQLGALETRQRDDLAMPQAHGTWLTVPSAHALVLFCQQRLCSRASSRKLEPLRGAGPGYVLCALLVSRVAHAARAHAERCRNRPRAGMSASA